MKEATMLYKKDGTMLETNEGHYDYLIVDAGIDGEIERELENGWRKTTIEADDIEFEGNVTREELEAKAKELNIGFNSKTSNETLTERINEALKEG